MAQQPLSFSVETGACRVAFMRTCCDLTVAHFVRVLSVVGGVNVLRQCEAPTPTIAPPPKQVDPKGLWLCQECPLCPEPVPQSTHNCPDPSSPCHAILREECSDQKWCK